MIASEKPVDFIINDPGDSYAVKSGAVALKPDKESRVISASHPSEPKWQTLWQLYSTFEQKEDPNSLLGNRFLCREGGLLIVGSTGIGKSTFGIHLAVHWAMGQPAFDITPQGTLRSLIIQAENDDFDQYEMFDGVCRGLDLSDAMRRTAGENIIIVRESAKTGALFFRKVVRPMLARHTPDLLWIDPALAYLGGESNNQRDVGTFLRNHLNPLLQEFRCAGIVLHHTNKPSLGGREGTSISDYAYAGGGSAEWANWARGVLVIRNTPAPGVFELNAAKRGSRIGWKTPGGETVYSRHIAHSKSEGQLFWRDADPGEIPSKNSIANDEQIVLDLVPTEGTIEKKTVIEECGFPARRCRKAVDKLVAEGKLQEHRVKRSSKRDAVHLGRYPQEEKPGHNNKIAVVVNDDNNSSTTTP